MTSRTFEEAVADVVTSGNCSGCGACVLISPRVSMTMSQEGFLRPSLAAGIDEAAALGLFEQTCPGRLVVAPRPESSTATVHPTFGRAERVWEGWASDAEVRHQGSSGGVITALTTWYLEQNPGAVGAGVAGSRTSPTLSAPIQITSRDEALRAAGSRYAPASSLAGMTPGQLPDVAAMKPCEASALRQLSKATGESAPLIFSFFCAGTPTQKATVDALERFKMPAETITELRYRGAGWPGAFTASNGSRTESISGIKAWVEHFNGALQGRCKVCVDGTGEAADVTVGDYWMSDADGNTVYDEADSRSVVIARTVRGRELVEKAIREGVIEATPLDLDLLTPVQEHQRLRRQTVLARMWGRRAAGGRAPTYRGYGLVKRTLGAPKAAWEAFTGGARRGPGREQHAVMATDDH